MDFAIQNRGSARFRHVIFVLFSAVAVVLGIHVLRGAPQQAAPKPSPAVANPGAIFKQYCSACHGSNLATAGINFDKLTTSSSIAENYQAWERVIPMLESKRMPP